jgi:hypothetical protein
VLLVDLSLVLLTNLEEHVVTEPFPDLERTFDAPLRGSPNDEARDLELKLAPSCELPSRELSPAFWGCPDKERVFVMDLLLLSDFREPSDDV